MTYSESFEMICTLGLNVSAILYSSQNNTEEWLQFMKSLSSFRRARIANCIFIHCCTYLIIQFKSNCAAEPRVSPSWHTLYPDTKFCH